jgi:hypothetical protein
MLEFDVAEERVRLAQSLVPDGVEVRERVLPAAGVAVALVDAARELDDHRRMLLAGGGQRERPGHDRLAGAALPGDDGQRRGDRRCAGWGGGPRGHPGPPLAPPGSSPRTVPPGADCGPVIREKYVRKFVVLRMAWPRDPPRLGTASRPSPIEKERRRCRPPGARPPQSPTPS